MALKGTTICAVKKDGRIAVAGDGQVTMGESTIFKATAPRRFAASMAARSSSGFAGTVADAFALCDRFEAKLEQFSGNLERAAVELAQEWRSDKAMRKLEAMLIVASGETLMIVSGTGEVIEPDDGIAGRRLRRKLRDGCRARAVRRTPIFPRTRSPKRRCISPSDICVFTNHHM